MKKQQAKEITALLQEIDLDISSDDIIELENFDDLAEYLQENGFFNIEIIYYNNALKYLAENDPSLTESLALAQDLGYTLDNLDSEKLASLLASKNTEEAFFELEGEISEILIN
jgi:hypothetical protein